MFCEELVLRKALQHHSVIKSCPHPTNQPIPAVILTIIIFVNSVCYQHLALWGNLENRKSLGLFSLLFRMHLNDRCQFSKCTFKGENTVKERRKTWGMGESFICEALEARAILCVSEGLMVLLVIFSHLCILYPAVQPRWPWSGL